MSYCILLMYNHGYSVLLISELVPIPCNLLIRHYHPNFLNGLLRISSVNERLNLSQAAVFWVDDFLVSMYRVVF